MCDTFIALSPATEDGAIIFGKNSNREPNEAQCLEYHPSQTYKLNETLQCTYLKIPQARTTYAVMLSRPFWMWGAEIGSNEKGVVIGNEAVFTRMPMSRKGKLTGMDLLRLALERSATAQAALDMIVSLLQDYGQGGICGYEDKRFTYHNSFIIADPNEAWILETAGKLWAARMVTDYYAISNRLSIGEDFDRSHPALIEEARKVGRLKKDQTFHFAHCFSDWYYTYFSASRKRQACTMNLLRSAHGKLNVSGAIKILRDHGGDTYRPDSHLWYDRLCAHAANPITRFGVQSTGSMVAHLRGDQHTYWATGTSAPCTGIFKPLWFENDVVPDIGPLPTGKYDPSSLWWCHEKLHRLVLADYAQRINMYHDARDKLEAHFQDRTLNALPEACWQISQTAFRDSRAATLDWIESVQTLPIKQRTRTYYRSFWQRQNKKAGLFIQY